MRYTLALVILFSCGCASVGDFLSTPVPENNFGSTQPVARRDPVDVEPAKNIDYNCQQRCLAHGYLYGLCQKQCSY